MRLFFGSCVDLGQPERLQERRQVHPEPAAVALAQPVPAADGVVGRAAPGLHGPLGSRLLLVRAAERHPVAVRLEHGVQVLDAAQVVAQLRRAHLADESRRIGRLVAVHLVLGRAGRCLQVPGAIRGCRHRQPSLPCRAPLALRSGRVSMGASSVSMTTSMTTGRGCERPAIRCGAAPRPTMRR